MEILELYMCREGKNFRRYIKRECLTVRLWTFQFFSLHCVFRFFFTKYFYLYNYERQWKECTCPWSDFGISVKATAILEVFETFEFSLMAPSHQLQSPVDSPFTISLGCPFPSVCLSLLSSDLGSYTWAIGLTALTELFIPPDADIWMSCYGTVLWSHHSLHRNLQWYSSVSLIKAGCLSSAFHNLVPTSVALQ